MSSRSVSIHRGSSAWRISSSVPRCAQYNATRNCSTSSGPKPVGSAPESRTSMAFRHRRTRSRRRRRALVGRALRSRPAVRMSAATVTASPAAQQNTSIERLSERTGLSGSIRYSETVTQAKPTVEASTNHQTRSVVICMAPVRNVMSAPITAISPARRLQERTAYDRNISTTRNDAAAHTAVRLSSTVTAMATAATTEAEPNVRARSLRWGAVTSSAAKKHVPAPNRMIGGGSATPNTDTTTASVSPESTVAQAVLSPLRVRVKPGSRNSSRAATRAITARECPCTATGVR